ncbi:Uncharacterised protein [Yersinia kristensenii]|nr:Uncharacterised protein [Yersinia kristensenii]CNK91156.1 Uncharacterised protein [Yersinia kristensenii]
MDLDRLQDPTGLEPVTYGLEERRGVYNTL